jgi:hypothetical protein
LIILKEKAFTLIEVLILSVVGVLAGGLLVAILVNNTGIVYQQGARVNQGLGLNDALVRIRGLIKQSSAIVSNYPEASATPLYTTSSGVLILKLNVLDQTGTVITDLFDYAIFFKDSSNLRFKVFNNPQSSLAPEDLILAKDVDSIIFDYFDSDGLVVSPPTLAKKVKATIVLKSKAGYAFEKNVATSEASLRND